MKIAVFHNLPDGGALRVLYEQLKYLSVVHSLEVFTTRKKSTLFPLEKYAKVSYVPFDTGSSKGFFNRVKNDFNQIFSLAYHHQKLARIIDEKNCDVCLVHADSYTQSPYLLRFLSTPSVYYCNELLRIAYEPELALDHPKSIFHVWYERGIREIKKRIDRTNARSATKLVTSCNYIKTKIKTAYQLDSVICSPGVDEKVFYPRRVTQTSRLLFVGEPSAMNGYELLLAAVRLLPQHDQPIIDIVSFDKQKKFITDDDMAIKYSSATATLCLGINEPFGLVSIESQACGTPVIALNEGGYKETVTDFSASILVDRDPAQLAAAIKKISKNKPRTNPAAINKRFTWLSHSQLLSEVLKTVCKK